MNQLIEDYKCYREGFLAQGYWALLFYRFGAFRFRFKTKLIRVPIVIIYIFLSKISQLFFGIYIGPNVIIGRRFVIEHFGCIIVHNNCIIGNDVVIRQGVTIGNRHADNPTDAPILGNNVSVGAGAKLLGKIKIGDNVKIGANAVVLKDIPDNSTAVGIPAKII
jgi:serine O-acetyltransferase